MKRTMVALLYKGCTFVQSVARITNTDLQIEITNKYQKLQYNHKYKYIIKCTVIQLQNYK